MEKWEFPRDNGEYSPLSCELKVPSALRPLSIYLPLAPLPLLALFLALCPPRVLADILFKALHGIGIDQQTWQLDVSMAPYVEYWSDSGLPKVRAIFNAACLIFFQAPRSRHPYCLGASIRCLHEPRETIDVRTAIHGDGRGYRVHRTANSKMVRGGRLSPERRFEWERNLDEPRGRFVGYWFSSGSRELEAEIAFLTTPSHFHSISLRTSLAALYISIPCFFVTDSVSNAFL